MKPDLSQPDIIQIVEHMCPFMGLNTFQNVVISNQSGPYIYILKGKVRIDWFLLMTIFNAKHILELFKQNDNFSLDTVSG